MSRFHSRLNSTKEILLAYKGEEPFAAFIKKYFAQQKKYGSTDRKRISNLCYCYFRLGKALEDIPVEEKALAGLFLCSTKPHEILENLKPGWNEKITDPVEKKYSMLSKGALSVNALQRSPVGQFATVNIFPWKEELSEEIDHKKFSESFLTQPDLFLRLRPGYENIAKEKITTAKIDFKEINARCLALPNTSKMDSIVELDREAVVQDYSSQRACSFIESSVFNSRSPVHTWDCCAGSGGKSLMLHDLYPNIELTVSDVRESILINLKKRFRKAGIANYKNFVADLTAPGFEPLRKESPRKSLWTFGRTSKFQLIIADVPCTGSGTWGRTPEAISYFKKEKIVEYALLQKKITGNVMPHLKPGGYFLYSTCSVFKKENEDVIDFIKEKFNLALLKMELLKGYNNKADTMFAALLQKTL